MLRGDAMTTLPLPMLPPQQPARIIEIRAGHRLKERLAGLGLVPGGTVEVLRDNGGPLLLAIGDTRLALGRGMAHKVLVSPITEIENKGAFAS